MKSEKEIRVDIAELTARYPPDPNFVIEPRSFAAGMIVAMEHILGLC